MSRRPPSRPPRSTIEDVAAAAGVSLATVSRSLRGLPNVADSTRDRVRQIAIELDYHPHPSATRLASGKTGAVAVVVPVVDTWYFSRLVAGVDATCRDLGFEALVLSAAGSSGLGQRLATGLAHAVIGRADAAILVDLQLDETEQIALRESCLPVATIGDSSEGFTAVGIDNTEVGRIATEHLIGLGHRRIGLVGGQRENPLGLQVPTHRRLGYLAALAKAGIEIDPGLIVCGEYSVAGGHEACAPLLDLDDPPTGIVAMSDEIAFGIIMAANERGLSIPDDLSIVGIDDHDVAPVVGLTTVHQDVAEQGSRAARAVLDMLGDDRHTIERILTPISLQVRRSTRRL